MDEIKAIALMRSMLNKPIKEMKDDIESITKGATAHQQLVTDADGNVKWEDRTHYRSGLITATLNSSNAFVSENGEYGRYGEEPYNSADPETKATWGKIENDIWVHFNEIWAGNSERRPLVFYWDGVRFETPLVFRLPFIYNGLENGLPYMQFFQSGQTAKIRIGYNEPGEHTLSYEARDYQLKQIDEDFMPTSVPVIKSARPGQTLFVNAVDENGKPTEWVANDMMPSYMFFTDDGISVVCEREIDFNSIEPWFAYGCPMSLINNKTGAVYRPVAFFSPGDGTKRICYDRGGDYYVITVDIETKAFTLSRTADLDEFLRT